MVVSRLRVSTPRSSHCALRRRRRRWRRCVRLDENTFAAALFYMNSNSILSAKSEKARPAVEQSFGELQSTCRELPERYFARIGRRESSSARAQRSTPFVNVLHTHPHTHEVFLPSFIHDRYDGWHISSHPLFRRRRDDDRGVRRQLVVVEQKKPRQRTSRQHQQRHHAASPSPSSPSSSSSSSLGGGGGHPAAVDVAVHVDYRRFLLRAVGSLRGSSQQKNRDGALFWRRRDQSRQGAPHVYIAF